MESVILVCLEREQLRTQDFGVDYMAYPLVCNFFGVVTGSNHSEYTFILDMDHRQCTVKAGSKLNKTIKDLPNEVWPAVAIKRGHIHCCCRVFF